MGRIEPEELGRLFDRHASGLVLYARGLCDRPEDVVQDAFGRLAGASIGPDRPVAWLHRVVRHLAIDAGRRDRRRLRREARAAPAEAWFAATDDRIDAEEATRLLAELPEADRLAVVARVWGGLTFDEIARAQGCSIAAAHRRYRSGLDQLHRKLEPRSTAPAPGNSR